MLSDIPVDLSGQGSATQSTVRQIGSALGSAVVGAVLSIGLAHYLGSIEGPAENFTDATRGSAGGAIAGLRESHGPDEVIHQLSEAFASATQWAMFAALAFLILGLVASLRILQVSRRESSTDDSTGKDEPLADPTGAHA